MHALLEGRYELGWVAADEIKVGDVLLKGDNLVRKVRVVLHERMGYHRFVISRLDSDVLLGEWEMRKGSGCLVLRDVTPPPPAEVPLTCDTRQAMLDEMPDSDLMAGRLAL